MLTLPIEQKKLIKNNSHILLVLVCLEVCLHGYLIKVLNPYIISVLYFLVGIGIASFAIVAKQQHSNHIVKDGYYWKLACYVGLFLMSLHYADDLWDNIPIDYAIADMLPVMQIMTERLLSGDNVYSIIPEIWGGMQPIYLPTMWMPFILSTILEFDMRFIPLLIMFLGLLFVLDIHNSKRLINSDEVLGFIPLALLIISLLITHSNFVSMTEEGIVIGYYMILCFALVKKSPALLGIAVALCLMSRYSFAVWLMMYFSYLLIVHERKYAIRSSVIAAMMTLALMTFGQSIFHLDVFLSLPDNYLAAIIDDPSKYKPSIHSSLGLAKLFPYENLSALHTLFKIFAIGIPIICLLGYLKFKAQLNGHLFAICSLKLSMVFFYNLLIMPYMYLFYTSTFISIALYFYFVTQSTSSKEKQIVNPL